MAHGLEHSQALARYAATRQDNFCRFLLGNRLLHSANQVDSLLANQDMRTAEQVPVLCRLERLQRPQLVDYAVRQRKHLARILRGGHCRGIEGLEAGDREGAIVAELDSLAKGSSLAGIGLLDGRDVGLLLEGLGLLLWQVPAALDRRRGVGGQRAARREGCGEQVYGLDARRSRDRWADQRPHGVGGGH